MSVKKVRKERKKETKTRVACQRTAGFGSSSQVTVSASWISYSRPALRHENILGEEAEGSSLPALSLLLLKSLIDAAFSNFPVLCTLRFHLRRIQPNDD